MARGLSGRRSTGSTADDEIMPDWRPDGDVSKFIPGCPGVARPEDGIFPDGGVTHDKKGSHLGQVVLIGDQFAEC
jgi:hypothetical protein